MHNCCLPKEGWVIGEVQRLPQKKRGQGQGISSRSHWEILGPLEATRQTWKCGLESARWEVEVKGKKILRWESARKGKMDQMELQGISWAGFGVGRAGCSNSQRIGVNPGLLKLQGQGRTRGKSRIPRDGRSRGSAQSTPKMTFSLLPKKISAVLSLSALL